MCSLTVTIVSVHSQVVQNLSSDDEEENLLCKECSRGGYSGKTDTSGRMENTGCVLTTKV